MREFISIDESVTNTVYTYANGRLRPVPERKVCPTCGK